MPVMGVGSVKLVMGPLAVMVARTVQLTRSVETSISYCSPVTLDQVRVGPVPPPTGMLTTGLKGTCEINNPLVETTAWTVKVTLLPVLLPTARNQEPSSAAPSTLVRNTTCSLLVPGLSLLAKKGADHGSWLESTFNATFPLSPYNSNKAAAGSLVMSNSKKVFKACNGVKLVVNAWSLVKGMMVGVPSSMASMV